MRLAALLFALAACGDYGFSLDLHVDASSSGADSSPPDTLRVEQLLPAGGRTVAIGEHAQYTATIGNVGSKSGHITAFVSGSADYKVTSNTCTTLASGARCEIEIDFVPSRIGTIDATLIAYATPGGTAATLLHGTGLQRNVLTVPDRVDFHSRAVGQTSSPILVFVTNIGDAVTGPLTVTLGAGGTYAVQSDGCTGQRVFPQATCTFWVTYTPIDTPPLGGVGDLSTITVAGTPGGISLTTLAGSGATILMDEYHWLFPSTPVGVTSEPKTLTLTNTQSFPIGPLTTDLSALGAAFTVEQDHCNGATLAAQTSCTYVVAFHPVAAGDALGAVHVTAPQVGTLHARAGTTLSGTGQ